LAQFAIDGITYEHDVVIDHGSLRKRYKKPSKKYRDAFGPTPFSIEQEIPWDCRRLVVGTGTGWLLIMAVGHPSPCEFPECRGQNGSYATAITRSNQIDKKHEISRSFSI
jgi:hypothetical protein